MCARRARGDTGVTFRIYGSTHVKGEKERKERAICGRVEDNLSFFNLYPLDFGSITGLDLNAFRPPLIPGALKEDL